MGKAWSWSWCFITEIESKTWRLMATLPGLLGFFLESWYSLITVDLHACLQNQHHMDDASFCCQLEITQAITAMDTAASMWLTASLHFPVCAGFPFGNKCSGELSILNVHFIHLYTPFIDLKFHSRSA